MELTNHLKRRFVKDYKLPIQIVQEPYFSYFLFLFQPITGSMTAFERFNSTLEHFDDEEQFFQHASMFSSQIVEHVKNKQAYDNFSHFDMNAYKPVHSIGKQNLYNQNNAGQTFVSIDLKKANFQALRFYDQKLVDNNDSYESFVKNIVDTHDYFVESKQIRQVIFGNLNPKRQQTIQKYMISLIVDALIQNGYQEEDFFSTSSDEIVVKDDTIETIADIIDNTDIINDFELHIERFTLNQVHPEHSFFVKEFDSGEVEFKNVPVFNMAEVVKHYFGCPLNDKDLSFFHEGRIAQFKEPLLTE